MTPKITRRALAGIAAAALNSAAQNPQAPPLPANAAEELTAARNAARTNAAAIAAIPLPMTTEPAAHFKA